MLALIFTTYKPSHQFEERIEKVQPFCDYIIIVDNTPNGYNFSVSQSSVLILQDGKNKGLADALNDGIRVAIKLKVKYLMLFDQDSEVTEELVGKLYRSIIKANVSLGNRICIGPNHVDDKRNRKEMSNMLSFSEVTFKSVSALPTSGITFCIDALTADDYFDNEMFLDFVDFDWCWKLGKKGWMFYRIMEISMFHRLGLGEYRVFNVKFYKTNPYRHYYQIRDTLRISFKAHTPLYSRIRLLSVIPFKVIAYPIIFGDSMERLKWSYKGFRDFILNVKGIGAGKKKLAQ